MKNSAAYIAKRAVVAAAVLAAGVYAAPSNAATAPYDVAATAAALTTRPITCWPDWTTYDNAARLPAGTVYWAGVGGYYDWATHQIGLTPQTCLDLERLHDGYTWQRGYAAFTLAHELGHQSGLFDEAQADCYGAGHAAEIAWLFGLRGRSDFVALRRDGMRLWGYNQIPVSCFGGDAS